jgi:abortive infection Abi-like protein
MSDLPNALIADIASVIGDFHTHAEIDIMFTRLGAPGDPPLGNKVIKVQTWLRRANEDPTFDAVPLLGGVLEELMDREVTYNQEHVERKRADIVRALARHGLSYQRGGIILGATLSTPSRSVDDFIRQKNLPELQKEFDRALANVESDPPSAITAACAILESTFKVIIAEKALTMPSDQSILPLWKPVQEHLQMQPGKSSDPHVRQVPQGVASTIHGIAGMRSNTGSAHGRGPGAPTVEPRHARLAVPGATQRPTRRFMSPTAA